jgi:Cu/Ag efflux pump CusA
VRITVNYPGVAPEVMEEQVTRVLERNLASVENLSGHFEPGPLRGVSAVSSRCWSRSLRRKFPFSWDLTG